ncbi:MULTISPECIES: hypothetical protein [Streptomyces]|uniref:hypothetical protein n=1 Tax=Streptomyces TaxID=1883 RepID=UPI00131F27A8|nr:hypothetical protein [Streptomyces lunaelactis]NUK89306.1 hypothetical protein [Streptomyces lunaelactis]
MDEDQIARAVARGMHQYEADQRAAERRRVQKLGIFVFIAAPVVGLLILASFGKLG